MIIGNNYTFLIYNQDCFLDRNFLIDCFTETFFETPVERISLELDSLPIINIVNPDVFSFVNSKNTKTEILYTLKQELTQDETIVITLPDPIFGKIYYISDKFLPSNIPAGYYGIIELESNVITLMLVSPTKEDQTDKSYKLFEFTDSFSLSAGMISNYKEDHNLATTVGRFLLNKTLLVDPFNDKVPYINDSNLKLDKLEAIISEYILSEIDPNNKHKTYHQDQRTNEKEIVRRINIYKDNVYFIGHFGELAVPSFTEKSLVLDPKIVKLKYDLLEKHKNELNDPNVLVEIEKQLIEADKERLKGDVSEKYFLDGKNWSVQRKRMFLMTGLVETFSDDANAYDFIPNSLSEGWTPQDMTGIVNEIRKGIYGRAVQTADTGTISKFLLRIFQNTNITDKDCGTTDGLELTLTESMFDFFIKRYIITPQGLELLTYKNKDKYMNKVIKIRSPMYCKTFPGICKTCAGQIIEQLNLESVGVFTLEIVNPIFTASMKSMHGKSITNEIFSDITTFLV